MITLKNSYSKLGKFGTPILLALLVMIVGFELTQKNPTIQQVQSNIGLDSGRVQELEEKLKKIEEQEKNDTILGQYALNMMQRTSASKKLSDGKKQVLARAIVRVSNDVFDNWEHKKAFISAIAIESAFQRFAQSPTGPKGYAQLAKSSFHEAMKSCGVTKVDDDDVWETDLNLYAGACYFRSILESPTVNGDPFVAVVAYNQGPNSDAVKGYAKSGNLDNVEALKYVAKFTFLKRNVSESKEPDALSIHELPKPGKNAKPGVSVNKSSK